MGLKMKNHDVLRHRVNIRKTGGSSILTIPKDIMEALGAAQTLEISLQENGEVILRREDLKLENLLVGISPELMRQAAIEDSLDDDPVGNEL